MLLLRRSNCHAVEPEAGVLVGELRPCGRRNKKKIYVTDKESCGAGSEGFRGLA